MINRSDLRVGNYIEWGLKQLPTEIIGIELKCVFVKPTAAWIKKESMPFEWLTPVPLTESLILQLGIIVEGEWKREFVSSDNLIGGKDLIAQHKGHNDIELCDLSSTDASDAGYVCTINCAIELPVVLKYLHQLQNVYYSLTGKELIFQSPIR